MLSFNDSYFLGETRDNFYIEPMMKCVWAAQLEVMCVIQQICEKHNIPYFADWGTLLGAVRHKVTTTSGLITHSSVGPLPE